MRLWFISLSLPALVPGMDDWKMGASFFLFVCMSTCGYVCRDRRRLTNDDYLPLSSWPYCSFVTVSLTEPEAHSAVLSWLTGQPSHVFSLRLQACTAMPGLYVDVGDLNSDTYGNTTSALTRWVIFPSQLNNFHASSMTFYSYYY